MYITYSFDLYFGEPGVSHHDRRGNFVIFIIHVPCYKTKPYMSLNTAIVAGQEINPHATRCLTKKQQHEADLIMSDQPGLPSASSEDRTVQQVGRTIEKGEWTRPG